MPSLVRRCVVPASILSVVLLAGCTDHARTGSGTGGPGAGAAAGASGVSAPTGGATGTISDGTTVGPGSGTTNASHANPGATDAADTVNPGDVAR